MDSTPAGGRAAGPQRAVVFAERIPVHIGLAGLDLDDLRRRFSDLLDRAARAVQLAGYDQDDCVIERSLICQRYDAPETPGPDSAPTIGDSSFGLENSLACRIPAEPFSDRRRLVNNVTGRMSEAAGCAVPPEEICITSLEVVAELEHWPGK